MPPCSTFAFDSTPPAVLTQACTRAIILYVLLSSGGDSLTSPSRYTTDMHSSLSATHAAGTRRYYVLSVAFLKKCYHVEVAVDADGCITLEGKGGLGKLDAKTIDATQLTTLSEMVAYMSATDFGEGASASNAWKIKLGSGIEPDGALMAPKWRLQPLPKAGGDNGGSGSPSSNTTSAVNVAELVQLFAESRGRSVKSKLPSGRARLNLLDVHYSIRTHPTRMQKRVRCYERHASRWARAH